MATTAKTRRIEIRVTEDEHTLESAAATAPVASHLGLRLHLVDRQVPTERG